MAAAANRHILLLVTSLAGGWHTPAIGDDQREELIPPVSNPLLGVPETSLSTTRERPIFIRERRPRAEPVAEAPAPPAPQPVVQAPPPTPEEPPLALVGTAASRGEGIGIFVEQPSNTLVRITTGNSHAGWTLQSVGRREATLMKDGRTVRLALPAEKRDGEATGQSQLSGGAIPGNTWTDGDGNLIAPPSHGQANPTAGSTWRDGDGNLIAPPSTAR
jgi:hypothetical protein